MRAYHGCHIWLTGGSSGGEALLRPNGKKKTKFLVNARKKTVPHSLARPANMTVGRMRREIRYGSLPLNRSGLQTPIIPTENKKKNR